jgi:hypothetical protein
MTTLEDHPLVLPAPAQAGPVGTPIDTFAPASDPAGGWGARLRRARQAAEVFRREFVATGTPDSVRTHDLVSLPYPTRFGLWRAALSPVPFVTITNRMLVVRWHDSDGRRRTLLFEPSDVELDRNTPYFKALAAKTPSRLQGVMVTEHGSVLDRLAQAGIAPDEVDYIVFDHLHTQDVRRWLGTTRPQPDISPSAPVTASLPNARLLVQRSELDAMADLHPLQRPWYQPETYVDLPAERLVPIDGDVLLGPGVALLSTPGHVLGNQSLVLNTSTGIWASSENAIAAECLTPEHSKIPGVARWARTWGQEVVLNANTIETTAEQYNSMVVEKTVVDRAMGDSRFLQFFPSSELTRHRLNPGTAPTFTHGAITHGA